MASAWHECWGVTSLVHSPSLYHGANYQSLFPRRNCYQCQTEQPGAACLPSSGCQETLLYFRWKHKTTVTFHVNALGTFGLQPQDFANRQAPSWSISSKMSNPCVFRAGLILLERFSLNHRGRRLVGGLTSLTHPRTSWVGCRPASVRRPHQHRDSIGLQREAKHSDWSLHSAGSNDSYLLCESTMRDLTCTQISSVGKQLLHAVGVEIRIPNVFPLISHPCSIFFDNNENLASPHASWR